VRDCREGRADLRVRDGGGGSEGGFRARASLQVGVAFGPCSPGVRHGSCSGEMRGQDRYSQTAGGIAPLLSGLIRLEIDWKWS
jgi:hypothetical protein